MWNEILKIIKVKGKWERESISECFKNQCLDRAASENKALPCTVAWTIWLARNEMIFQGKELLPIQVSHQVRYAYKGIWKPAKVKSSRILKLPDIEYSKDWRRFDGANQGTPGSCGTGGILYLTTTRHIVFEAAFGTG